jgi:hypothetical protein
MKEETRIERNNKTKRRAEVKDQEMRKGLRE